MNTDCTSLSIQGRMSSLPSPCYSMLLKEYVCNDYEGGWRVLGKQQPDVLVVNEPFRHHHGHEQKEGKASAKEARKSKEVEERGTTNQPLGNPRGRRQGSKGKGQKKKGRGGRKEGMGFALFCFVLCVS